MFSEDFTSFLRKSARGIGVHLTTRWRFLRGECNLFPYTLQMQQQINDEDKIESIKSAQYRRHDLENGSRILILLLFLMSAGFHSLERWTSRAVRYAVQSVQNIYSKLRTTLSRLWYGAPWHKTQYLAVIFLNTKTLQDRVTELFFETMCFHGFETFWRTWYFDSRQLFLNIPLLNGSTQTKSFQTIAWR